MSQTTCCPACQTLFKVVPDQLRVSEGWVRCGQCSEIFDAHLHIFKEPFAADIPLAAVRNLRGIVPSTTSSTASRAALGSASGTAYGAMQSTSSREVSPELPVRSDAVDTLKTEPVPLRVEQAAEPGTSIQGTSVDIARADTPQDALTLPSPLPVPQNEAEPLAHMPISSSRRRRRKSGTRSDSPEPLPGESPEVTFLRAPKGNAFWGKLWVRTCLGLVGTGLAIALMLQVILHQRDRIAATVPAAKPAVLALCQLLGCRVLPLRQIESMMIDGSTFTELRGNAYRLGFTVKNNASVDLALPAIELTLTDTQDRAALRRVFLPAEMGATSAVLGAGAEWTGSLVLSIRTSGATERISGYRIAAIYP